MRNLSEVVEVLLEVIPNYQTELLNELKEYKNADNTVENWNGVGDILFKYIFSDFYPEVSWQADVERIWTGDEDADNLTNSNF